MDAASIAADLNRERFLQDDTALLAYMTQEDSSDSELEHFLSDSDGEESFADADGDGGIDSADGLDKILARIDLDHVNEHEQTELDKIRNFDCKCHLKRKENSAVPAVSCLSKVDLILNNRVTLRMAAHSEEAKDAFVEAILFASTQDTEMTISTKKTPQKRQRRRTTFQVHNTTVCRDAFLFSIGMGRARYQSIAKNYLENGGLLRERNKSTGVNKLHLTAEDVRRVVMFITNYAEDRTIALPGRHPNHRDFSQRLLPSCDTKTAVHKQYTAVVEQQGNRAVALSTFRTLWKKCLPHIATCKPRTDLCATCHKNNYEVYRSSNLPESVKSAKLKKQEQHLDLVKKERDVYNKLKDDCKQICKENNLTLAPSTPASKNIKMHYSFDYAQQLQYPHDPFQAGPMYFLAPRKCGLFGVHCEGLPKQVNYLIDEAHSSSKGSNAVISYLHHFFNNYGVGETDVDLHCDNCSGQNKNSFMMWYFALRTIHKLHLTVSLHFLLVGHTKFSPDWGFGLVKRRYNKSRVDTLSDLAKVVEDSTAKSHVNIPMLVGQEDGTVLVQTYNWQEHLKQYFKPLPQIKSYQHFSFDATRPGVVVCRQDSSAPEVEFQLLREPGVFPGIEDLPVLPPPGLEDCRKKYLFEKIRDYVSAEGRDVVCPAPTKTPIRKPVR